MQPAYNEMLSLFKNVSITGWNSSILPEYPY